MDPIISIIVPCYNGEKFLRETLDCLQKQTIENWECIIVNDGSTDGSLGIIKEYATKDKRYRYINKKNGGPAIARNVAITSSIGKYILPLDADDLIEPSYAEMAISYLESHIDTKLVYCDADFFGTKTGRWNLKDYSFDELLWENMIFCSAVYRRSDFDKSDGYNPEMTGTLEDWDFWLTFLKKDDIVYKIPETLFHYRQHEFSRNVSHEFYKSSRAQIVKRHLDLYMPHIYDIILYHKQAEFEKNFWDLYNSKTYQLGLKVKFILEPLYNIIKKVK